MDVGVRALRNNLSSYLDQVKDGAEVTVTEHGRPVARLVPLEGEGVLDRLIREGKVRPARRPKRKLSPPSVVPTEPVSPLVAEQRR
jgi:prevent-host-death family protein